MAKLDNKLRAYFALEREALAAVEPPADFEARIRALVAEQEQVDQDAATPPQVVATAETAIEAASAAPLPSAEPPSPAAETAWRIVPKTKVVRSRSRQHSLLAAVAAVVLVIFGITSLMPQQLNWPEQFRGLVEIYPAYASETGIDVNQGIIIRSSEPISAELVEKALEIEPAFSYVLEEQDEATYRVVPTEPMDQNTVYRFHFDPERSQEDKPAREEYSWAFQTEAAFALSESSPQDGAYTVPLTMPLTLTFNETLAAEAAAYVTLQPEIAGAWQVEDNQLIFIPEAGWQESCLYQVELSTEVASADGDRLAEAQSFSFETESSSQLGDFLFGLVEDVTPGNSFLPEEFPNWQVRALMPNGPTGYRVTVYSIPGQTAYLEALEIYAGTASWHKAAEACRLDAAAWPVLQSWELPAIEGQGQQTLALPETLPHGYYLAELQRGNCTRQVLFQVSGLTAYAALGEENCLFWLHDAGGQAVAEAQVSLWNGTTAALQGVTDAQGLLVAPATEPAVDAPVIYVLETAEEQLVLTATSEQQADQEARLGASYCHYLSTDRRFYTPGETVQYFGVLDSQSAAALADTAKPSLRISGGALKGDLVLNLPVQVEDGAFHGSFTLPTLQAGWYQADLYLGEMPLSGCYFEVGWQKLATWHLQIKPEKPAAPTGEEVIWQVIATDQGRPLQHLNLVVEDQPSGLSHTIVTDAQGQAEIRLPAASADAGISGQQVVGVRAELPGRGALAAENSLTVLSADTDLGMRVERLDASHYRLEFQAYTLAATDGARQPYAGTLTVTVDTAQAGSLADHSSADHGEAAADLAEGPNPPQEGLVYLELVGAEPLVWEGELATAAAAIVEVSWTDQAGRVFVRQLNIPAWSEALLDEQLVLQDAAGPDYGYAAGEAVHLQLYQGASVLGAAPGSSSLFVMNIPGQPLGQVSPTTANTFLFTSGVNSLEGWAVYYAAGRYHESNTLQIKAAQQTAPLYLEIEAAEVNPEDGLKLFTLYLQDAAGQPVQGVVNINVTACDEAALPQPALALREHLLQTGYRSIYSHHTVQAVELPAQLEEAESGAASDAPATSSHFITLYTNEEGRANCKIDWPETSHSGQLIWQAYGAGQAASGSLQVPGFPGFRLTHNAAQNYHAGDAPLLRMGVEGEWLAEEAVETVLYHVSISALDYEQNLSGGPAVTVELNLPALSAGTYELRLTAVSGNYHDTQVIPLTVSESAYQNNYLRSQPLAAGNAPELSTEGKVTLVFSNQHKADTLADLFTIANQQLPRFDQKLAALAAAQNLSELLGLPVSINLQNIQRDLAAYQQPNGGLSLWPEGESWNELSALAAPLVGDYIDRAALTSYLRNCFNQAETAADQALALCGLAGLGQPVLLDIETLLAQEIDGAARLYLALGQLACGNGMAAKEEAAALLAEYTTTLENGMTHATNIGSDDGLEITRATARLALLANAFALPEGVELYNYLLAQQDSDLYLLEQVRILLMRMQEQQQPAFFSYQLAAEGQDVNLEEHKLYTMTINAQELSTLSFRDVAGDLTLTLLWQESGVPVAHEPVSGMQISRDYQLHLDANGLAEVRLHYNLAEELPPGSYTLVDALPAGLRFIRLAQSATSAEVRLLQQDGQKLVFSIEKGAEALSGSVVYRARLQVPGTYTAEAPYLYREKAPDQYTVGLPQTVNLE